MRQSKRSFASNKFYYRFFRSTFLIVGATLTLVALLGIAFPELVIINNEQVTINGVIIISCLAAVFLILHLLIRNRFAYAVLTQNTIILINPKKRIRCSWNQVVIKQLPFIFPPLYKITLPDGTNFLFNTGNKYLFISVGIIIDLSEMGEFIKLKTKSL